MLGGIAIGFDGAAREAAMLPNAFGGLIPFQPTTARIFAASDTLRLFGHVYWKEKGVTPVVTMALTGPNGTKQSTARLIAQKPAADQQDAVVAAILPMQGLTAGKYHLAVSATLPGGKPVARDVLFEVR